MFSGLLGLAGAGASIYGASLQYNLGMEQLALQREALENQKNHANLQYGLGLDQLRKEREIEEYIRRNNERNEMYSREEYAIRQQQYEARKQEAMRERQYVIDRQIKLDQEAAKRQQFILQQYLENKEITQQEREYAISMLEEAKAVAKGERNEDIRRRAEEDLQAQIERDFAIEEMRRSQSIAALERQEDFAFRQDIISRLDSMAYETRLAYEDMPEIQAPELLGREDFDGIFADFDRRAISNVDRAVDRVASQGEAQLMRSGLGASTAGTQMRADIARRMSVEYDNARQTAMEDALRYITGNNDVTLQAYNARKDARSSRAAEIQAMTAPTINAMLQSRGLTSANAFVTPVQINSGISARQLGRSANQFAAPVGIGTAAIGADIGIGMFDTLSPPSTADTNVFNAGTNQFAPNTWQITSPSGFFGNAAQGIYSIAQHYDPTSYFANASSLLSSGASSLSGAGGGFDSWMGAQDARRDFGGGYNASGAPGAFAPATQGQFNRLPFYGPMPTPAPRGGGSYTIPFVGPR